MTIQEAARKFKQFPGSQAFFFTADNTAFFDAAAAGSHAATLPDRSIVSFTRADILSWESIQKKESDPEKKSPEPAKAKQPAKSPAPEKENEPVKE